MKYEDKIYIDDFLNGNELNRKLYQVLLFLQDNSDDGRICVRLQPKEIFNRVYEICEFISEEKHPEELASRLWKRMSEQFISPEVSVIFSCVYIVLSFTGSNNPNMVFFLTRIKQLIDQRYFKVFEPLLEEELYDFPQLPKSFSKLKTVLDALIEVVTFAGPEKVRALNIIVCGDKMITKNPRPRYMKPCKPVCNGWLCNTCSDTPTKLEQIQQISKALDLGIKASLI